MIIGITFGTFLFFGACTVLAFLFAYLFVPETKGVALEDIGIMFGNGAPIFARAARKRYEEAHEAEMNRITIGEEDEDAFETRERV